jgi:LacI family transcriptional regulator
MSEAITLHDVARAADVSTSTVSRILNGTAIVADDKRERVLEAIKQLGYRPNVLARGLVRGQSMNIGVLTQAISSLFHSEALMGIEEGLSGTGYHPIFVSSHLNVDDERGALELLISRQVDAIILAGSSEPDEALLDLAARIPLVIVGHRVAGLEHRCISIDNAQAAPLAVEHLISLGHRQIAYISGLGMGHPDAIERFEAYRATLEAAGIPYDPRLVADADYTKRSGVLAAESLLARGVKFTGMVCTSDQVAYGARLALYRHGIQIPEDVSLVGFDDLEISAYVTPPLTTVRQPILEMGRLASKMIVASLAGQDIPAPKIQAELIVRESTAAPPGASVQRAQGQGARGQRARVEPRAKPASSLAKKRG